MSPVGGLAAVIVPAALSPCCCRGPWPGN